MFYTTVINKTICIFIIFSYNIFTRNINHVEASDPHSWKPIKPISPISHQSFQSFTQQDQDPGFTYQSSEDGGLPSSLHQPQMPPFHNSGPFGHRQPKIPLSVPSAHHKPKIPSIPTLPQTPEFEPFSPFSPFHNPSSDPEGPEDQLRFAEEGLKAHNKYRELHGAPPLTLDKHLIMDAYKVAQVNADENDKSSSSKLLMHHSNLNDRGENLFALKGANHLNGHLPVEDWYDEIKHYNWSNPCFRYNTGHFTAVIWKGTRRMGMAWVKSKKGVVIAAAQYKPQGNFAYVTAFRQNVLPPLTDRNENEE